MPYVSNVRRLLAQYALTGSLPAIAGGAGDTTTTYTNVLKEYYPAQGIVNQIFMETYLLNKFEKVIAKAQGGIGGRY